MKFRVNLDRFPEEFKEVFERYEKLKERVTKLKERVTKHDSFRHRNHKYFWEADMIISTFCEKYSWLFRIRNFLNLMKETNVFYDPEFRISSSDGITTRAEMLEWLDNAEKKLTTFEESIANENNTDN